MKKFVILFFAFTTVAGFSQTKKIHILYSGYSYKNEQKYPGATILIKDKNGLVKIEHEGAILTCKQALFYEKKNFFKALGNVVIKQGDSLVQTSDYSNYNGNTKQALSWGNVVLKDTKMTLKTDTLHFNRAEQKLYYTDYATIKDATNTLESKIGTYYLNPHKFTATTKVVVTNPEHVLTSNHLDYYTNSGLAYLHGPSNIKGKDNTIYTEKGVYDTKKEISHFVKNSTIFFKERTIKGDSLYYNKYQGFASATNNIKLIDTVQNFVAKGNYAEYYEAKDSAFIVDKAVAITKIEKDSMYIHGDKILVTGKPKKRIVRVFHNVKIFKSDLQGKCDSIYSNQGIGLTKMYKNPVLWSKKNQITGDSIQLISNIKTNKLDSLKVLNNALVVALDTVISKIATYNQIQGINMYGKFIDGKIKYFFVNGNAQVIYYNRNKEGILQTITKQQSSSIEFELDKDSAINRIKYIKKPEGKSYPPEKLPKEARKLKGFIWRDDERPKTMKAIFNHQKKSN